MFLIRKIGKTLRGQAKPYQIVCAAILGSLVGFAPPFANAPFYLLGVVMLLAILNANFFIATFTAGVTKLFALALMPLSFQLGMLVVDGPLQPIFRSLINAPVTALMGFDYYVTAGGTLIGLVLGTLIGIGYVKLIRAFRRKMAKVEADSEKYADFVSKRGVRVLMWVLFGGKAKVSYAELAEQKKIGNPIRPLGVVFAVLLVGLIFIVQQFFSSALVTTLVKGQLESYNGATVDLSGLDLDLAGGQVTIDRLAMADPDDLATDLLRAEQVVAKLSTADLLRKRFTIDLIVIDDAQQGAERETPGVLIGDRPKPSPPSERGRTLDDYIEQGKKWRERLATLRQWLERLRGPADEDDVTEEKDRNRLEEWAERYGHANVRADHLIDTSPTILIKEIKINKLRAKLLDGETVDAYATNLSTHPALVNDRPRITAASSDQRFNLDLTIGPRAIPEARTDLKLTLRDQSIDDTLAGLDLTGDTGFKGGTWLAGIDGGWSDLDGLDLPLTLILEDTTLNHPKLKPTPIDRLPVEFVIVGPMDNPSLDMDVDKFSRSLMDSAGQAVLSQVIDGATDRLKDEVGGDVVDRVGDEVGGILDIFGGRKDKKDSEPSEEQKDEEGEKPEENDAVEDRVRDTIGDIFNRD
ncbi:MAG: hypothetical protein ACPGYV_06285 [Phycisphaeraceae bacterium]